MKHNKTLTLIALSLLAIGHVAAQGVVTVVPHSGNTQAIELSADGRIYFSDNQMTVYDGSAEHAFAIADVRKVLFSDPVGITRADQLPALTLSPNPASDRLTVAGCGEGSHPLWVYTMSGATVLHTSCAEGVPVDISALPAGIYIVRVGVSVAKLIKH